MMLIIRGGGDLASGIALRVHRAGFRTVITELDQPLAVRRTVSFAEAIYQGSISIEGVIGRSAESDAIPDLQARDEIPVLIDPELNLLPRVMDQDPILVDARMLKQVPSPLTIRPRLLIGLGPGFVAGENCDAVVETRRGHSLGRLYWKGAAQQDSKTPEGDPQRVLRAPVDGKIVGYKNIGDHCEKDELIAEIHHPLFQSDQKTRINAPLKGVLRGLIHPGLSVRAGMKIGDVDPRDDSSYCDFVSDKALAVGGAVLEALLTRRILER